MDNQYNQNVKLNRSMEDDLLDTNMKDEVAVSVDEQNDKNMKTDDHSNNETTPSVDENNTPVTKNECTFQRGGRCKIHGVIESKSTIYKKSWSKLKNGIHGW